MATTQYPDQSCFLHKYACKAEASGEIAGDKLTNVNYTEWSMQDNVELPEDPLMEKLGWVAQCPRVMHRLVHAGRTPRFHIARVLAFIIERNLD